jgi:putative heme-binding domain-containing protein
LTDEHPGVRRHAIRLSEQLASRIPTVADALLKLIDDPDPQVQMQLAYSLGEWHDPRAGQSLARLAVRHAADSYLTAAVMSSAVPHVATMIAAVQAEPQKSDAHAQLLSKLAKLQQDIKAAPHAAEELAARRSEPPDQVADRVIGKAKTSEEVRKAMEKFKPVLTLAGDPKRGKQVFVEATCSTCHRLGDVGTEIGPDLTALVDRSPQVLMTAVLDPNRAVVAKYLEHVALTRGGLTFRGMLLEETSNSITLADLAGKSQVILRKDLEETVSTGRSHMPEKLEEKLNARQMADLFAFIRQAKPAPRPPSDHRTQVVAADQDGSLRLLAHYCEIHADGVTFDKQQGCLVWHRRWPADHVAWWADVPRAGTYEVAIQWTQIPEYADNPFAVECGTSRLTNVFPSTGGWGKWQTKVFGTLNLPAGKQRIVLRPSGPIKEELSDIREIRLLPTREGR